MATPAIPTTNYSPRYFNLGATNSGSLTRTDIVPLSLSDFEDFGNKEIRMEAQYQKMAIARMAGIRECSLSDFIYSLKRPAKGGITGNGSLIQPYDFEIQQNHINANYFKVVSASATSGAGSNGVHPGARDVILSMETGASRIRTPLPELERFFQPGMNVSVEFIDGSSNAKTAFMKVKKAVNADSGGVYRTTVTLEPNVTSSGWADLSSPEKAVYEFTSGIAVRCGNSVSDYESYPYQQSSTESRQVLHFWHQTFRDVFEYDDLFLEALNAPLTSSYFKDFKTYALAQHRAQQEVAYRNGFVNACMFGDAISEHQTLESFANLEVIKDPANFNAGIEYKANMLGFRTILGNNGRLSDLQTAALNLDNLFAELYWMKREREGANAMDHTIIDLHTGRKPAALIDKVMRAYYKDRYGINSVDVANPEFGALKFGNQVMATYTLYELPDSAGVYFAVIQHKYFDDLYHAHNNTRGNAIWIPDLTDMEVRIHATSTADRKTDENDELYRYIIKYNKRYTKLMSEKASARITNPNRHFYVHNFSTSVTPVLTGLPGALA